MKMKVFFWVSICCLCFPQILRAQKFVYFTRSDGLSNNDVNCLHFDPGTQRLMAGTAAGVSIYDGATHWEKFEPEILTNQRINAICHDSSTNSCWFGTDSGLYCYQNSQWMHYTRTNVPGCPLNTNTRISCLFIDSNKLLWIGTVRASKIPTQGLIRYAPTDPNPWQSFYDLDQGLTEILALNQDETGRLWIGTQDSGLLYSDDGQHIYKFNTIKTGNQINALFKDHTGAVWVGSGSKVFQIKNGIVAHLIEGRIATQALIEDSSNQIWFAANDSFLYRYQPESKQLDSVLVAGSSKIQTLWHDPNRYLWFGTEERGIIRLNLNWQSFADLNHKYITDLAEDATQQLWVATSNNGIFSYDGQSFQPVEIANAISGTEEVHAIIVDQTQNVWCGTSVGAYRYEPGNARWDTFLTHHRVNAILQDRSGRIWFGTHAGVYWFDGTVPKLLAEIPENNFVNKIFQDDSQHLWFGTEAGVYEWFAGTVLRKMTDVDSLLNNNVLDLLQHPDSLYWFATHDGISRWNRATNSWSHINDNTGLQDNDVNCLFLDAQEQLWVGTHQGGLVKYDGDFWWNLSSNVTCQEVTTIFQSSAGTYWIGTSDGLVNFTTNRDGPVTQILSAPEGSISYGTPSFSFSAYDQQTPATELVYAHAIQSTTISTPLKWSEFKRQIFYQVATPLPNGTYTFWVKARDSERNEDRFPAHSASFKVDVTPPTTTITSPTNEQSICDIVPVIGTATDESNPPDLVSYTLSYLADTSTYKPETSAKWITICHGTGFIKNDTLGFWEVHGLKGKYWLRLSARDFLGHTSETHISVNIVESLAEIPEKTGGMIQNEAKSITLLLPPHATPENITLTLSRFDTAQLILPHSLFKKTALAYRIQPDGRSLDKPVILTFQYTDSEIVNCTESNLTILRYQVTDQAYEVIGGTKAPGIKRIQTAIRKLDVYALVELQPLVSRAFTISDIHCTPRLFSPRSAGLASSTNISFTLSTAAEVTIKIYNLAGRLVQTLCDQQKFNAHTNSVVWDGRDYQGEFCPSDLYVVTVSIAGDVKTKTIMILDSSKK